MRIGVVMPTYNQAAYLKDAVDSVMAQTVPIQGPVIVEDGSTDSTPEVLSAMRVRYVRNGENIGAARSINAGVVVLRGLIVDAISRVSSDNRMYPNWLEKLSEALKPGGRLVILTYHSLEDRMVKNFMRAGKINGEVEVDFFGNRKSPFRLVNNKVIVPDDDEVARNPRSRSAKLRIAELIG